MQKLRTRNPDYSYNKEEKRWYSWMRCQCRTAREKADMEELNALVNRSAVHMKRTIEEAMGEAVQRAVMARVEDKVAKPSPRQER